MSQKPLFLFCVIALMLTLTACGQDEWFGKSGDPVLPGKRIPVLIGNNAIVPDAAIANTAVIFPPAIANRRWPMAGGFADHVMQHLALNKEKLQPVWQADIGQGSSKSGFLVAPPVAADGKVFTIDVLSKVRAFDLQTGARIWDEDLRPKKEDSKTIASGGLAIDGNVLYATTGYADLSALDTSSGKQLWRQPVSSPLRTAPTVSEGKVLIIPVDNRLTALTAKDGLLAWMYEGVAESAALLGGSSPAISNGIAVAAFSSGDLMAFDLSKGRPLWSENLSRIQRGDMMGAITSVQALPVIHDGRVYAIGHSNRAMALDLQSGDRIWDLPIGGVQTPWITDNYLYVINNDNQLVAIEMSSGLVKWVVDLATAGADAKKYRFAGPVLAGGKLYIVGTDEKLRALSPQDGKVIDTYDLGYAVSIAPIVVDNTLVILTDSGRLLAYR